MTKKEHRQTRVEVLNPNHVVVRTAVGSTLYNYNTKIASVYHDDSKTELYSAWKYSSTTSKFRAVYLGETTKETQAKLDAHIYKLV